MDETLILKYISKNFTRNSTEFRIFNEGNHVVKKNIVKFVLNDCKAMLDIADMNKHYKLVETYFLEIIG